MSKIEWTQRTWNPIVGCSIISPGCTNCYAMKMAGRLQALAAKSLPDVEFIGMRSPLAHYLGTTQRSKAGAVWTGKVAPAPEHVLTGPLRRMKPSMYFVNSMSDLFHEDVPDEWILRVLDVIRATSHDGGANSGRIRHANGMEGQHVYQVLTKRSQRMRQFMRRLRWDGERLFLADDDKHARVILHNLWLGVSAERQQEADARIPDLLATPAAIRFVSCEPLLGPVDLETAWHGENSLDSECWGDCAWCKDGRPPLHNCYRGRQTNVELERGRSGLDWVIGGGESGPGARPMHPDWARSIRDQCQAAGVPFFFKQWGSHGRAADLYPHDHLPEDADLMMPASKTEAGRFLDGRTWDEMPATQRKEVIA